MSKEEIREGIDRDIEFVLMAAYHAGKIGESIDKCKVHLKKALHSKGVGIIVKPEQGEDLTGCVLVRVESLI